MQLLYQDNRIFVCIKPAGVLSTDEPGGMPERIRAYLEDAHACVRAVHRLDQAVSGVMVYARSRVAASVLSEQVRNRTMQKTYLAVTDGAPDAPAGVLRDLLWRDTAGRNQHHPRQCELGKGKRKNVCLPGIRGGFAKGHSRHQ